jgi:hypothetical protein
MGLPGPMPTARASATASLAAATPCEVAPAPFSLAQETQSLVGACRPT